MGPLVPDPQGRLDLPEGFSYAVVDQGGQTMSDGYRVPGNPDGMASFPGENGTIVLLRNHELAASSRGPYQPGGVSPHGVPPAEAYDAPFVGGVTRVVVDATTYERVSSNLVLVGTVLNCGGGQSPWGWLSCEETFSPLHGYTFLCPTGVASVASPQRIVGYGHFQHEAVAIDPSSNVAFLTEDRSDSALYRFVPDDAGTPFVGRLQALRVRGRDGLVTATGLSIGDELDVDWVELEDPDPPSDTLRGTARSFGAAAFRRGEGIWFDRGVVYFTCTSGGTRGTGQVFALRPTAAGGTLRLLAESEDPATLDGPDSLCVTPFGDLFLCEDGFDGGQNFIRGLTPSGALYDFARTTVSELAGACFSPDGRALFVNIFGADMTLVVTGPFPSSDPDGLGGQGGQGGAAGATGGGEGGEMVGGAPGRGGATNGGSGSGATNGGSGARGANGGAVSGGANGGADDTAGAAGTPDDDGGAAGRSGGVSGSGIHVGPARRDARDEGGCGCSVVGRR